MLSVVISLLSVTWLKEFMAAVVGGLIPLGDSGEEAWSDVRIICRIYYSWAIV